MSDSDSDEYGDDYEWQTRSLNAAEETKGLEDLCTNLKNTYNINYPHENINNEW